MQAGAVQQAGTQLARTAKWTTLEQDGMLFVWNDPEGKPPPPDVTIPLIEGATSDEWTDWHWYTTVVNTNCREIIDNVVDMAHFFYIHGRLLGAEPVADRLGRHLAGPLEVRAVRLGGIAHAPAPGTLAAGVPADDRAGQHLAARRDGGHLFGNAPCLTPLGRAQGHGTASHGGSTCTGLTYCITTVR